MEITTPLQNLSQTLLLISPQIFPPNPLHCVTSHNSHTIKQKKWLDYLLYTIGTFQKQLQPIGPREAGKQNQAKNRAHTWKSIT